MRAKSLQSCLTLSNPHGLRIAHQAPLSIGSSRQECWSGLPRPPPGDLPDKGVNSHLLGLLHLAGVVFVCISLVTRENEQVMCVWTTE